MSRKKDIQVIAPLVVKLRGINEREARQRLERRSARELRRRRAQVERVAHPMRDPSFRALIERFQEIDTVCGKLLAAWRSGAFESTAVH